MKTTSLSAARILFGALLLGLLSSTCTVPASAATNYTVVGWNNLGMHCMDSDYSVFSVLPPYNTINAQIIRGINGTATVLNVGYTITGFGKTATVKALLDAGARADRKDDRGKTAADMARDGRYDETLKLLERAA